MTEIEFDSQNIWRVAGSESNVLQGELLARESYETKVAKGRAARLTVPREIHASWKPAAQRRSPVDILAEDDSDRQPDLVPLRYGRMSASPFTFYRGAAAIMAADLENTPTTGIEVQLCGDAHLSNFGVFASPERRLVFDINDFDETLPGPWEWDLKRLTASFVIGCRATGFSAADGHQAALVAAAGYRERMAELAQMSNLDVWYSHIDVEDMFAQLQDKSIKKRSVKLVSKARSKDALGAFNKLTEEHNGHRRFKSDPPVLIRLETPDLQERIHRQMLAYEKTLLHERRTLIQMYQPVDIARKVVGVGSVGTRCVVILMEGRDQQDPLFIQIKEAGPSSLEGYLPRSKYKNRGQRVVVGQRLMQASSDIFLGWIRGDQGIDFYMRQLQDMKGSVDLELMRVPGIMLYAKLCGHVLARAHARSGDRFAIASYLGKSQKFDAAMADFAEAYADQNEKDYDELMSAIAAGKVPTMAG